MATRERQCSLVKGRQMLFMSYLKDKVTDIAKLFKHSNGE